MRPTPEQIVEAIQARGSNATELRDAAHEAHHAIDSKLRGPWEREAIHTRLLRKAGTGARGRVALARFEIDARAVEMIVCADYGIEYDVEYWSMLACMEAIKGVGVAFPSLDYFIAEMKREAKSARIRRCADAVIALGSPGCGRAAPGWGGGE